MTRIRLVQNLSMDDHSKEYDFAPPAKGRGSSLTDEQQRALVRVLRELEAKLGSMRQVAHAIGYSSPGQLSAVANGRARGGRGLVARVCKYTGQSPEEIMLPARQTEGVVRYSTIEGWETSERVLRASTNYPEEVWRDAREYADEHPPAMVDPVALRFLLDWLHARHVRKDPGRASQPDH